MSTELRNFLALSYDELEQLNLKAKEQRHGRVAAHMIGMAVRIDEARGLFSGKNAFEERQRLRYVGAVA